MESKQQQAGGVTGVRELMLLVGILVLVAAGTIATQWVRAKEDEASAQANVGPRVVAPSPTPAWPWADTWPVARLRVPATASISSSSPV